MLMSLFVLSSVANLLLVLPSVFFRVIPWQMLLLMLSCRTPNPLPSALNPIHRNSSILIYLKTMVLIKLCITNN